MIPLALTCAIFLALAYISRSRTYFILFLLYFVNFAVDHFTTPADKYLMWTYSAMDFSAAVAILFLGDIHKVFHAIILELMIFCHYLMEVALVNNHIEFIESDIYVNTIMFLLLCQIVGSDYGVNKYLNSLFDSGNHLRKVRHLVSSNRHKSA